MALPGVPSAPGGAIGKRRRGGRPAICGIAGVFGERGGDAAPAVERMVAAIRHRGPDDRGLFTGAAVSLGMTRLAVIDTSPAAHQPMSAAAGQIWAVYNGEVVNFREERALLERSGARFVSSSDTEVVVRLYERYGDGFAARLRGMFALAIYDRRRGPGLERLLLVRDPLGIKPLLYARAAGGFVFASELRALLASGLVAGRLDPEALRSLLTFGAVIQPRTMIEGVRALLPGHRLVIEKQGPERLERYWKLGVDRRPDVARATYPEQVRALGEALVDSVRAHQISDVPLGSFLSGGIDSSLLTALLSRTSGRRVMSFSVGFGAEGAEIDESEEARRTAALLGTDHTHVEVTGEDVRDRLAEIASSLDQPSVDGVNSYFVSLAARRRVTVAISGTGGDELFAGYPWFATMAAWSAGATRRPLVEALARGASNPALDPLVSGPFDRWVAGARSRGGFLARFAACHRIFPAPATARLIEPGLRRAAGAGRAEAVDLEPIDELPEASPVARVTALCLRGYTCHQLLRDIDAMSMAHSLEVRVPFLDVPLLDLALSLPDDAKLSLPEVRSEGLPTYKESGAKRILIDAARAWLPEGIENQPKRGFSMPFQAWLEGPLASPMAELLAPRVVRSRGWLDERSVTEVAGSFRAGRTGWAQPWLLMMIELWARTVLDRASPAGAEA